MVDLIDPTIGKLATCIGWDGTDFRVLRTDHIEKIMESVRPLARDREEYKWWDLNLAAGGVVILTSFAGMQGYVSHIVVRVNGIDTSAKESYLYLKVDDIHTSYLYLHEALYLCNGVVGNYADIDVIEWDVVNDIYWLHWNVYIPFWNKLELRLYNGDPINPITYRILGIIMFEPI